VNLNWIGPVDIADGLLEYGDQRTACGSTALRSVDRRVQRAQSIGGAIVKAVIIGEPSGASMEQIMAVYPRHKVVVEAFKARGEVIGIGPFADRGNMGIFRTRAAAEEFARQDPFILEGLVKSFVIRDWNDTMLD
jgi:uncharacterized protein YciI